MLAAIQPFVTHSARQLAFSKREDRLIDGIFMGCRYRRVGPGHPYVSRDRHPRRPMLEHVPETFSIFSDNSAFEFVIQLLGTVMWDKPLILGNGATKAEHYGEANPFIFRFFSGTDRIVNSTKR